MEKIIFINQFAQAILDVKTFSAWIEDAEKLKTPTAELEKRLFAAREIRTAVKKIIKNVFAPEQAEEILEDGRALAKQAFLSGCAEIEEFLEEEYDARNLLHSIQPRI